MIPGGAMRVGSSIRVRIHVTEDKEINKQESQAVQCIFSQKH